MSARIKGTRAGRLLLLAVLIVLLMGCAVTVTSCGGGGATTGNKGIETDSGDRGDDGEASDEDTEDTEDTDVSDLREGQVDPSELVTEDEASKVMEEPVGETVVRVNEYFHDAAEVSYRAGAPSYKQVDVEVVQTDQLPSSDGSKTALDIFQEVTGGAQAQPVEGLGGPAFVTKDKFTNLIFAYSQDLFFIVKVPLVDGEADIDSARALAEKVLDRLGEQLD